MRVQITNLWAQIKNVFTRITKFDGKFVNLLQNWKHSLAICTIFLPFKFVLAPDIAFHFISMFSDLFIYLFFSDDI